MIVGITDTTSTLILSEIRQGNDANGVRIMPLCHTGLVCFPIRTPLRSMPILQNETFQASKQVTSSTINTAAATLLPQRMATKQLPPYQTGAPIYLRAVTNDDMSTLDPHVLHLLTVVSLCKI